MSKSVTSGGISFTTALFLVFLVLKLTNTITWSWWFVTMPLWIGPLLIIGTCFVIFIFGIILSVIVNLLRH